jgi:RNA:NAD 2'-phosphotransferase (TPT1/KptA family)
LNLLHYTALSGIPEGFTLMAAENTLVYGKPVIYLARAGDMKRDGYAFYRSVNGVWLTKKVPVKYLQKKIWT